jgi:hypothetical protein
VRQIINGYGPILKAATSSSVVIDCARRLTDVGSASIKTLTGSARSVLVASLWTMGSVPVVVVVADDADVDAFVHDLSVLIGANAVIGVHGAQRQSALAAGGMVHHEQMDALGSLHETGR